MQLVIFSIVFVILVWTQDVKAQIKSIANTGDADRSYGDTTEVSANTYVKPDWKTIDINFLSSYYSQDGNNGAVTGGIGSEALTDFTQKISASIPLKETTTLNADVGYDYYSSESTDNIDNIPSSDSSSDVRVHSNLGIEYALSDQKRLGFRVGGSSEYDYFSINGGMTFELESKDRNTSFQLGAQAFFDDWTPYYPAELRGKVAVPTTKRRSYNASIVLSKVINRRMQVSFQLEGIYMEGLLSTPFHRVYFVDQDQAGLENLPGKRLKVPLGIRVNNHLTEYLISRLYYRYYWDDWGIRAHTFSAELPVKVTRFFTLYPYYRYNTQNGADYFRPYKEHSASEEFYTSDYDLSPADSHTFGIGVLYGPPDGLARMKLPLTKNTNLMVKGVEFKYGRYSRSTGLKGYIASVGVNFSL